MPEDSYENGGTETKPKDVVRVGDIIVRVNEDRTRKEVAEVMKQPALQWILVIARLEVFNLPATI